MADISEKELKKEIAKILKNDKKIAPKKVRQKLEGILDTDLSDKKKLIERLVTEYSNKDDEDEDDEKDEDEDDEDEGKKKSSKRSAPTSKSSSKKSRKESSDEAEGSNDSGSEDEPKKKPAKRSAPTSKGSLKKARKDSSDEDGSNENDSEDDKKGKDSDGDSGDEDKKESTNKKNPGDLTKEEFKAEIAKILENANLAKTSSKKVRLTLEKKLGADLSEKRKLIDQLVMEYVTNIDDEQDEDSEEEEAPRKKKKKGSDNNDGDWRKGKAKKAAKPKKGGGRGKGGGYTRAYKLSPALAELMGEEEMPRHEVVRRIWDIIKTKQLYDPNNKQFAICDTALYKVFGTNRFRTFGMMKYLKTHFLDD